MESNSEKKTSKDWYEEIKYFFTIHDPDGWDRKNFDYSFNEELITKEEFKKRICLSTVRGSVDKLSNW